MTACTEFHASAAELAVGVLSGGERAAAVAHLSGCPSCRRLMVDLTAAADDLLLTAPELEPPPGFESRVLARLGDEQRGPRRSRWRALLAVAAVVVVAALGGGLAAREVSHDRGSGPGSGGLRTALAVSPGGRMTCRVVLTGGEPAKLLVSLDGPVEQSEDYVAEVQPVRGPTIPVGRFSIADGHGMLATTVASDAANVKSVRVLDTGGKVLYEAFPEPVTAR